MALNIVTEIDNQVQVKNVLIELRTSFLERPCVQKARLAPIPSIHHGSYEDICHGEYRDKNQRHDQILAHSLNSPTITLPAFPLFPSHLRHKDIHAKLQHTALTLLVDEVRYVACRRVIALDLTGFA